MHAAGINFPGHTEIFAARTNAARSCMMQYSEEITCTFVTVHVGYHEVPGLLTKERILDVIELTAASLKQLRGREPKIVVCGLNPHAGEHGLFGNREEERIIIPAIEAGRAKAVHQSKLWVTARRLPCVSTVLTTRFLVSRKSRKFSVPVFAPVTFPAKMAPISWQKCWKVSPLSTR